MGVQHERSMTDSGELPRQLDDDGGGPSVAISRAGRLSHWWRLVRVLGRFTGPHTLQVALGIGAALVVVALRLSLPWTLKAALKPWLTHGPGKGDKTLPGDLSLFEPAAWMAGLFLGLLVLLGLMDMISRVAFARFSIATVRDLRAAAFRAALSSERVEQDLRTGDVIARLVGDTTRIKAGMKGFLVHVATNGAHYLGATGVLLWLSPPLGAVFALSGMVMLWVTYLGAVKMYEVAAQYRTKEGKLADTIHWAWDEDGGDASFAKINRASGSYEAALTKTQGMVTWIAHGMFGLTVVASFWIGLSSPVGRLDRGEMVLFVLYAMTLRSPMVQLVRQGTRTGKILACMARLDYLLGKSGENAQSAVDTAADGPRELSRVICLSRVKARAGKSKGRRRKLGYVDVSIAAGERVIVVGPPGSGKTTLLRLIAGLERSKKGAVLWDDQEVSSSRLTSARAGVTAGAAMLPQVPRWRRMSMREFLGVAGEPTPQQQSVIEGLGVGKIIARLPEGLEARVGSQELSAGEARVVYLARVVLGSAGVLLLDEPFEGTTGGSGSKVADVLTSVAAGRTVIAACRRPVSVGAFDRVIELKKGRIVFDGRAQDWTPGMLDQSLSSTPVSGREVGA